MKVSGREVADKILENLKAEIEQKSLHPHLAIILAGPDPASRIYVNSKMKAAARIGVLATLLEYTEFQKLECLNKIDELNKDSQISGIIVQQPMYEGWDSEQFVQAVDSKKDVDGFKQDSPFKPATALGIWEMLGAFAQQEGFKSTEEFLKGKKIVVLGRGKTAGGPARELLTEKGFESKLIHSKTENPDQIIKNSDVVISATGRKHLINSSNIKEGSYIIGVGVGRDEQGNIIGDIDEEAVSQRAKMYCPTIGGIGPLTIACLLRNVLRASQSQL